MPSLTRDEILNSSDASESLQEVAVPEWGGSVFVRVMSGSQRDRFEAAFTKDPGNNLRARMASYVIADENGKPIFTEADIVGLGEKSASALSRVFDVAVKVNALTPADVGTAEKN